MSSTLDSVTQVILVGLATGILFTIFAWRSAGTGRRIFFGLIAACLLVPTGILLAGRNPWIIDSRYRTFLLFYWNIRIGMNREEVLAEMQDWYPPNEPHKPPKVSYSGGNMEFIMTPESTAEPDHESFVLKMQDDRVMGKDYVPD